MVDALIDMIHEVLDCLDLSEQEEDLTMRLVGEHMIAASRPTVTPLVVTELHIAGA